MRELPGALLADLISDVIARGMPFRFHASGSSMLPFIHDGDMITIIALPLRGPGLGDVVAFRQPASKQLLVHRLVGHSGNGFLFKGDFYSRGQLDGPISIENLLGIVAGVERDGRPIRLGLGPERRAIALVSRSGLLRPITRLAAAISRRIRAFTKPSAL
jgi:hypothetical protein